MPMGPYAEYKEVEVRLFAMQFYSGLAIHSTDDQEFLYSLTTSSKIHQSG